MGYLIGDTPQQQASAGPIKPGVKLSETLVIGHASILRSVYAAMRLCLRADPPRGSNRVRPCTAGALEQAKTR